MVTRYSFIVNFVFALRLGLSKPQFNHIISLIHGVILTDGRKTITQLRRSTNEYRDLSCMTRFLNESPWCPNRVTRRRLQYMMDRVKRARAKKGDTRPVVFFIVDDTQCKKDRTTRRMEGLDDHFSHSDGKTVWSHCLVTAHLFSEGHSFAWDFRPYFRESYCASQGHHFKSKNDLAIELIQSYQPLEDEQVYVLVDSWYTSKKLIDSCNQRGYHLIGGIRTNRKIYPKGIGIKLSEFASDYVATSDLHSVTVDDHSYKVYSYEGPLSDVENVRVLLSWENGFRSVEKPFCLLCTDCSLNVVTILRYYNIRWNIETGYRYFKDLLGFDEYQLLSRKGIERFWCVQFLAYNYLECQRKDWEKNQPLTIGDVVRRIRKEHLGQLILYTYEQALKGQPLANVLSSLKLVG